MRSKGEIKMKLGVIGSRSIIDIELEKYVPTDVDSIVSGGARGADSLAAEYARKHGIPLTVIPPDYERYGRAAPIVRNKQIVDTADGVLAFWNGSSRGTRSVINYAKRRGKPISIIICD